VEVHAAKINHINISSRGIGLSSDLVHHCAVEKIPVTFFDHHGSPYAVLQNPTHAMSSLSVLQVKIHATEKALELTKGILMGKSRNQMNLLKFYLRHRKKTDPGYAEKTSANLEAMEKTLDELQNIAWEDDYAKIRERLMLLEARISAYYWDCVKDLLPDELGFAKRDRHGARDLVNMLLNYGYGFLYQRLWNAVTKAGLNPCVSFLHAFQASKPTLVYDLIEEFRQPFVDRTIFSLLTKGKKGADMKVDGTTGYLDQRTKNVVTKAMLHRLGGLTSYRGEKVKSEEIIELQVKDLVEAINSVTDGLSGFVNEGAPG